MGFGFFCGALALLVAWPIPGAAHKSPSPIDARTFLDEPADAACMRPQPLREVLEQTLPKRLAIAYALAQDTQSQGISTLYLLAHDVSLEVRMAALQSALSRCPKESPSTCMAMLRFFNENQDSPGAYLARDALLFGQKNGALAQTLVDDKLELIAQLATHIGQPGAPAAGHGALRLLAEDEDPQVQEAAGAWLMTLER